MKSYLVHMKLYVMEILPDKYYTELGITFVKSTGTGGQNIIWLFDHLILLVLSCFKQAKRCFFYLNETIEMRMDQSCKNLARSWKTCLFLLFDQPVFSFKQSQRLFYETRRDETRRSHKKLFARQCLQVNSSSYCFILLC